MDVLHPPGLTDDDPDWNRVEFAIGQDRLDFVDHVFSGRVIFDAHRHVTPAGPCGGVGGLRQPHLVHLLDEAFQQLRVAAGEDKLHGVTADLSGEDVEVQICHRRDIVKADEGMVGNLDRTGLSFNLIVWFQAIARVRD